MVSLLGPGYLCLGTMVNNRPVLIAKLKLGFNIISLVLDERFGAQVTLTYFCHADRPAGFVQAFSLESYL